MIEVGVGVIAACLPMLRPVLHAVATSNILQKVRSALSNARLLRRSKDKSRDRTWKPTPGNAETESQSSQRRIVGCEDTGMQKPQHVESYALGPISARGGWSKVGETSPGGIIHGEDKTFRSVDQV